MCCGFLGKPPGRIPRTFGKLCTHDSLSSLSRKFQARNVFLKANIDDHELEDKVKAAVEVHISCTENSKFTGWASHVYHKGFKYLVCFAKNIDL
jgi:hypothetical protein